MDNNTLIQIFSDPVVIAISEQHPLFSYSQQTDGMHFQKHYAELSAIHCVQKMANIHNTVYPENPYYILPEKSVCTLQQKWSDYREVGIHASTHTYELIGEHIAFFHSTLTSCFPEDSSYPTIYDAKFFEDIIPVLKALNNYSLATKSTVDLIIKNIYRALKNIEIDNLGGVHGDLHTNNILVSKHDVRLIDFDMVGYGNRVLDFAVMFLSLGKDYPLFQAFAKGYSSKSPLSISWEQLRSGCFLAKVLCIYINVLRPTSYKWLPDYIKNTAYFLEYMPTLPPANIRDYFS